jgi:hypothetical protein
MHREEFRDLFQRTLAGDQQASEHTTQLANQIARVQVFERGNPLFKLFRK